MVILFTDQSISSKNLILFCSCLIFTKQYHTLTSNYVIQCLLSCFIHLCISSAGDCDFRLFFKWSIFSNCKNNCICVTAEPNLRAINVLSGRKVVRVKYVKILKSSQSVYAQTQALSTYQTIQCSISMYQLIKVVLDT